MKVFITVLCMFAVSQAAVLCPDNACDNVKCETSLTAESCSNNGGLLKVKAGFCGCCDMCVQQLGEGDDCSSSMLIGVPATSECTGKDLYCDFKSRTCTKPTCAMKKKELEDYVAKLPMRPLGLTIPECAADGSYAGKQCSGSQCYCVDDKGTNIGFEHNKWETDDKVLCQCARDRTAYFARGIIGRLFHCTDMGDYHTVQCNGSVCFCADRKTGKMLDSQNGGIHISAKDKLKC